MLVGVDHFFGKRHHEWANPSQFAYDDHDADSAPIRMCMRLGLQELNVDLLIFQAQQFQLIFNQSGLLDRGNMPDQGASL